MVWSGEVRSGTFGRVRIGCGRNGSGAIRSGMAGQGIKQKRSLRVPVTSVMAVF